MISAPQPFTLEGFFVTSAFRDDNVLSLVAYRNNVTVDEETTTIQITPTHLQLNWSDIDRVTFSTEGGTVHVWPGGFSATGNQFAIDNLVFHFDHEPHDVPEPTTAVLLLSGLVAMVIERRRRRCRQRSGHSNPAP